MFIQKIKPLRLGIRRLCLSLLTATLVGAVLLPISSHAEIGGVLYIGGTGPGDVDATGGITKMTNDFLGVRDSLPNAFGLLNQGRAQIVRSTINSQPQAKWLGAFFPKSDSVTATQNDKESATEYVLGALRSHQVPVLVLYYIPNRDCGQAGKDGSLDVNNSSQDAYAIYRNWINAIAVGIADAVNTAIREGSDDGKTNIMVMLEPDSIGLIPTDDSTNAVKCWLNKNGTQIKSFDPAARFVVLRDSVWWLSSAAYSAPVCHVVTDTWIGTGGCPSYLSRVKVYLDGGHSAWEGTWQRGVMAKRLVSAGIDVAQGFFTNPSNYQLSSNEIAYGGTLIQDLNGELAKSGYSCNGGQFCAAPQKTQVIDVSRNGNGPYERPFIAADGSPFQYNGWPAWCDNQQALLGQHPTLYANTYSGVSYVDGLIWIKNPGETDGCWGGPMTADNTQPDISQMIDDQGSVPDYAAGWDSAKLGCGLATGIYGWPAICDIDVSSAPPAPTDVRITHIARTAEGASANATTLEWEASRGACGYVITRRVGLHSFFVNSWSNFVGFTNNIVSSSGGFGPPTRFVDSSQPGNPWPSASAVYQYAVQAVSCKSASPRSSALSFGPLSQRSFN